MITPEQKQEADEVVDKYYLISIDDKSNIKCAIQDRQSVLDELEFVYNILPSPEKRVLKRIQSLTNQITYLKSKI